MRLGRRPESCFSESSCLLRRSRTLSEVLNLGYLDYLPIEQIISEYITGKTLRELGKKYNCSHQTIRRRLIDNNVHMRTPTECLTGKTFSDERKKAISERTQRVNRTPEYRAKMSIISKRNMASKELRKRISQKLKGRLVSDEARRKQSASRAYYHPTPETREKVSQSLRGSKSPRWLGGISFGKYCDKFNRAFKERIKAKFGNRCYICPSSELLCVHHIDYLKNSICNGKEWAFVPLCKSHHAMTNWNRWYWFNLFINYWAMDPSINFSGDNNYIF